MKFIYSLPLLILLSPLQLLAQENANLPSNKPKYGTIKRLPEAISNNAVAGFVDDGDFFLASFNGLTASKKWQDIVPHAFLWTKNNKSWLRLPDVPGKMGRLASTAIALNNKFWIAGGYTVNEDGSEISTAEIFSISSPWRKYRQETRMPLAVDDSGLLSYKQQYLLFVSGWHDDGNTSKVQIYDSKNFRWFNASAFPGVPVFGHSGAIVGNKIIIVDGVGVVGNVNGKRQFTIVRQSWIGTLDPKNPSNIRWVKIKDHPGPARYRMAAVALKARGQIVFIGGSRNPYNYNGIGYNKQPSVPEANILIFDLKKNCWLDSAIAGPKVMDLRGAVQQANKVFTIGGMDEQQKVLDRVLSFDLNKIPADLNCY